MRLIFFAGLRIGSYDNDIRGIMTDFRESPTTMSTNAAEELRAYEAYVAKMAALADGTVILNHSLCHAAIVLAQIFKTASKSMKIVSGDLDARAYGVACVREAAVQFLERDPDAFIAVLTEHAVGDTNPFLAAIKSRPDLAVRFHLGRTPASPQPTFHFAVGDDAHFRFESDKEKPEAFVKFGDRQLSAKLIEVFQNMLDFNKRLPAAA